MMTGRLCFDMAARKKCRAHSENYGCWSRGIGDVRCAVAVANVVAVVAWGRITSAFSG
jgi:hypothetical protein